MKAFPAERWNAMIERLRRCMVTSVTVLDGDRWRHPWQVRPVWDAIREVWCATVQPGFVSGLDASVEVLLDDVTGETRERLKRSGTLPGKGSDLVEAWLTETPVLRLEAWRAIGPDATATSASENPDGTISLAYEKVPPFFAALGVGEPPAISFVAGILNQETTLDPAQVGRQRLLRALDVVLKQDRVASGTQWTTGEGLDGTFLQFDVTTVVPPNLRQRAYLGMSSKWEPPVVVSQQDRVRGDWVDTPRDERLVATVYLVSPPGLGVDAVIDGSWTAYVQHKLFWNLTHATNYLRPAGRNENLMLQTGLAGGVGDRINQLILAQVNDANSVAAQFLLREEIQGRFWTV